MADTEADTSRNWAHCVSGEIAAQRPEETDHMTEYHADFMPGLVDLTSIAFKDLIDLDESLVDCALDRLLPPGARADSRLWNQGGCTSPDEVSREIRA
jgi:hypothetical protein